MYTIKISNVVMCAGQPQQLPLHLAMTQSKHLNGVIRADGHGLHAELHHCAKFLQDRVKAYLPNAKLRLILEDGDCSSEASTQIEYPTDEDGEVSCEPCLTSFFKFVQFYTKQRDKTIQRVARNYDGAFADVFVHPV
jgi:hypothetical protein